MKKVMTILAMTIAILGSGNVLAADGHCNYTQENMFAGPFKVCQMPTDAAQCSELGNTDDNADAEFGDAACSMESAVGTCDMGESKLVYYEGDPSGLEIGCGFQSGEWINAE